MEADAAWHYFTAPISLMNAEPKWAPDIIPRADFGSQIVILVHFPIYRHNLKKYPGVWGVRNGMCGSSTAESKFGSITALKSARLL
jgi:hypothetical protein